MRQWTTLNCDCSKGHWGEQANWISKSLSVYLYSPDTKQNRTPVRRPPDARRMPRMGVKYIEHLIDLNISGLVTIFCRKWANHQAGVVIMNATGLSAMQYGFMGCAICGRPLRLATAKSEHGDLPVHEACHLLRVQLKQETMPSPKGSTNSPSPNSSTG